MNVRHASLYGVSQAVTALVGFLSLLVYTRLLPTSEYGAYAVCMAAIQVAHVILFGWVGASINRFYPVVTEETRGPFLSTAGVTFVLISACTLVVGTIGFRGLLKQEWRLLLVPSLGLLVAWAGVETILALTRAELAPGRFALASIGRSVFGLVGGAFLAAAGWGARGVLLGVMLGCGVSILLEVVRYRGVVDGALPDSHLARTFAIFGIPVAVSFVLEWVLSSSDRLLLAWLTDTKTTGLYAAAYALAQQPVQAGAVIVSLAMYPVIVRSYDQGAQEELKRHLESAICAILAISIPAGVGLWVLTPNIAETLLGSDYHGLSPGVVGTVAAGVVLSGLRTAYTSLAFFLTKKTAHLTWSLLVGAVLNLGLNLALIPRWGALGAGWSTLIGYAAALAVSIALAHRTHRLPWPLAQLGRIGLCAACMGLMVAALADRRGPSALVVQVVAGLSTYALLFAAFNVMGVRAYLPSRGGTVQQR